MLHDNRVRFSIKYSRYLLERPTFHADKWEAKANQPEPALWDLNVILCERM